MKNISTGKAGEGLASKYIEELGYVVLGRNIREKFGEIDILARDKQETLCFVEVKTITAGYADYSGMEPEDNLSMPKLIRMRKMAESYSNNNPEMLGSAGYRIDLVCIKLPNDSLTNDTKDCDIKLYTNLI